MASNYSLVFPKYKNDNDSNFRDGFTPDSSPRYPPPPAHEGGRLTKVTLFKLNVARIEITLNHTLVSPKYKNGNDSKFKCGFAPDSSPPGGVKSDIYLCYEWQGWKWPQIIP